jgi:hypothetical protein
LPAELQGHVNFAVGDAAQALVKFMSSPEAAPLIRTSAWSRRRTGPPR